MAGAGDIKAGAAYVSLTLKNGLPKGLADAQKMLANFGSAAQAIGGTIARAGALVTGFGVALAGAFAPAVKAAADAEQLQVAFTTMLGSAEKATALIADIRKFAAETPFESKEIGQSAKQLLAYGFSANESMEALKMLGDVASGVSAPLGDIAYLYGTSRTQGRLFSVDIKQFTGRGIPIIAALAKQFGVADNEVMQLASDGKIHFEHLENAMKEMTGKGGQYFMMMEAQSKTLAGRWSTLKDNFALMAVDIGNALMPMLKDLMERALKITDTFSQWVKQNAELIATVAKVAVGVAAAGAAITAFGVAIVGVGAVAGGIVTTMGAVGTSIAFPATPVGIAVGVFAAFSTAVIASIGAVAADSAEFRDTVKSSFQTLVGDIAGLSDDIARAIKTGDMLGIESKPKDPSKMSAFERYVQSRSAAEERRGNLKLQLQQKEYDKKQGEVFSGAGLAVAGGGAAGMVPADETASGPTAWLNAVNDALLPLSEKAAEMANFEGDWRKGSPKARIEKARQKSEEDEQADWIRSAAGTVQKGREEDPGLFGEEGAGKIKKASEGAGSFGTFNAFAAARAGQGGGGVMDRVAKGVERNAKASEETKKAVDELTKEFRNNPPLKVIE